mgnify:CR=1 FL=1
MNKDNNKRRAKRIDFSCEAKIRFLDEDKEISVNIKDISLSGVRVIIGGRIVNINTPLAIRIRIKERYINCKGRITWVLALRPGLGNINVFDVGIEFTEMNPEDRAFLEKLLGQ